MSVRLLHNYVEQVDTLIDALPEMRQAHGLALRNSDTGAVSIYNHIRWQWYSKELKAAWRSAMPKEVTSTFLVSTFLELKANEGKLYPTTIDKLSSLPNIGCFLSVALKDDQLIQINGRQYELDKGDAILFDVSDTYETDVSDKDALWSVNIVPAYKKASYGSGT